MTGMTTNHARQAARITVFRDGRTHPACRRLLWLSLLMVAVTLAAYSSRSMSQPQTHLIWLSHHEFESWSFTPHPNDTIDIINHSDISHSIYVTYPDGTVENLGVQVPGETVSWTVPAAGNYLLQCWIHPVIRSSLVVKEHEKVPAAQFNDTAATAEPHNLVRTAGH